MTDKTPLSEQLDDIERVIEEFEKRDGKWPVERYRATNHRRLEQKELNYEIV